MSPAGLAAILKTKPNDYSIPGGVQFGPTGVVQILGIPIIPCQFISGTNFLAGDFVRGASMPRQKVSA